MRYSRAMAHPGRLSIHTFDDSLVSAGRSKLARNPLKVTFVSTPGES